jgi:hypothetical protein
MEYADGGSVQDSCDMVYKQHGKPTPLTARDAWQVTSAARFALKDLHAAGYIHRDVKVDNMLHIYRSGRAGTIPAMACKIHHWGPRGTAALLAVTAVLALYRARLHGTFV